MKVYWFNESLNDVNSRYGDGAVSMCSRSVIESCSQILATSSPQLSLGPSNIVYLVESARMTTQETSETIQVDKDL